MSVVEQKKDIFGKISAQKVLTGGLPKFQVNPSLPFINNDLNPLNLLNDLLATLSGMESMKDVIIDILSTKMDGIEDDIKQVIKKELNRIVSCDINPSIPNNMLHKDFNPTSKGINLELRKIDFNDMFLMDPESLSGSLMFSDYESGVNSKDFNSFLYSVLQSDNTHGWGSSTIGSDILDFTFKEEGEINNVLNVKVSKKYSDPSNNLRLRDLNNDYIDSIDLLDTREILTKIVDNVFGTISKEQKRSKNQLIQEAKINAIIDRLINQEDDNEIDDSYFEFDNNDLMNFEVQAEERQRGVKVVQTTKGFETNIDINALADSSNKLKDTSKEDLSKALRAALDGLSEHVVVDIPKIDKYAIKLDFIQDIVKNLMRVIGSIIISPKIITILMLNFEIIYGKVIDNPIDFILKNKYLMKLILNGVRDIIMDLFLSKILKDIEELALNAAADIATEQIKITQAVTGSLVGLPSEVTRMISGIIK
jgi:hypothetical protein